METLNLMLKPIPKRCLNFRQLSVLIVLTLISAKAYSIDHRVVTSRSPSSAFDEEVLTVPLEQKVFIQTIFSEDDSGVMKGTRDTVSSWQETEEYAKKWDLESTNLYNTPTMKDKKVYISKNLLRYADKRLAGELKNAEEGSTLQKVGNVEKSLRPNASVPVSKHISLKFKARVLQGKATMEVRNPWIECSATVKANGQKKILTKKDFNQLGTSTGIEYDVGETQWIAFLDQQITSNIKGRLSSSTMPNGDDADKKVELNASFPFNL